MNNRTLILIASMLVTFVLGSVHAFSVFIVPLEHQLILPRSEISLIYSWTLVAITFAVLLGYRIYALVPPWLLVLFTCMVAAAGLYLASRASNWWILFMGYSLLFGLSNGVGYGFSLQLVGRVMPEIKGFAMGAVTAAYAVGSIVFAKVFAWRISSLSIDAAFLSLMLGLIACGLIAAMMMYRGNAAYGETLHRLDSKVNMLKVSQFWFAYMTSVFAGLMAIGHAAGIVLSKNSSTELATLGAMMIGVGSALGGFLAGWLIDRWSVTGFLVGLPLASAGALLLIGFSSDSVAVVGLLSVVGFCYGAIIAIYPVAISNYFTELGPKVYGQVFTAWGFAGLVAPWFAGLIFDLRAGYEFALVVAAMIAIWSALTAALCKFEKFA